MPKVSVIVPVYNVEKYIGRCIESIQRQTLTDWELILIDDCSADNSFDAMQEYAKNDNRIIIKRHEANHGPMIARRWGDEIANGEYITYCDGDDMLPDNALEVLYIAAKETDADIISGNHIYISEDGKKSFRKNILPNGNDKVSIYKSLLKKEFRQVLWGKLYKTSLLQNYSYKTYDHFTNGEDAYMLYQIVENINKIVMIEKPVYFYMQNMQSSTNVRYKENAIQNICILNKKRVTVVAKYPELKQELQRCVTEVLCSLYVRGYDKDTKLNDYIKEYGLSEYVKLSNVIKTFRISNLIKLIIKRTFFLIKWKTYEFTNCRSFLPSRQ